jgi:hypothetical protein
MSALCKDCDIDEEYTIEEEHPFFDNPLDTKIQYPDPQNPQTSNLSLIDASAYSYGESAPEEIIMGTCKGLTGDDRFYNLNKKRAQANLDSFHMFKQNYRRGMERWHREELAENIESRNNWLNDYFPDFDKGNCM